MQIEVTPAFLKQYFTRNKRRACYQDAKTLYDELRIHANGETPGELLMKRRPSETEDIFTYRKEIYEPITMEPMSSIIRSLGKIRRSADYMVRYDGTTKTPAVADGETLEQYCEKNFPYHKSVTNWAFSILLKNQLIDANAVIVIAPLESEVEANEYYQPYPVVYNSDQVYEFIPNQLAILLSTEKTEKNGNIFIVVTGEEIQRWEQVGTGTDYQLTDTFVHGLDEMPCVRIGGQFKKAFSKDLLFTSHLEPIVPRLNEAAREYSDMQAEVVQHIFSEKWEYATQKCEECMDPMTGVSTGKIKTGNGKRLVTCTKCNGTGTMGTGPYKKMVLRQGKTNLGEMPIPTPPAGYIQKQIDIVKLQDDRIDKHIYKALSAINMQFLAQTPLNQSGKAKEVDSDELNNFIYGIAEQLIKTMDEVYCFINEYRYSKVVASPTVRAKQLPTIPVPEKYDILSSSYLVDEISKVKQSSLSDILLQEYEMKFANSKFNGNRNLQDMMKTIYALDPFAGADDAEKLQRKQGGGITELDYVISCNITRFVKQAFEEDGNFCGLSWAQQRAKMETFAQKVIADIKPKAA